MAVEATTGGGAGRGLGARARAWLHAALGHFRRARRADYANGIATDAERALLAAGAQGPAVPGRRAQDFLAWRRSALGIAMVLLAASAVFATFDLVAELSDKDVPTVFGKNADIVRFTVFVHWLAEAVLPVAALLALRRWAHLRRSHRSLRWGWLLGFLLPIALFLIPMGTLFEGSPDGRGEAVDPNARQMVRDLLGVMFGLKSFVLAIPPVLSVFFGTMRAGFVVRRYAPEAAAPGVAVAVGALLLVCLLVPVLVTLIQATGDPLVIVGSLVLLAGILVYPLRVRVLARPCSEAELASTLAPLRRTSGLLIDGGLVLLLVFGFTAERFGWRLLGTGDRAAMGPSTMAHLAFDFAGRAVLTAVLFSDVLLDVVRAATSAAEKFRASPLSKALDVRLGEIAAAAPAGPSAEAGAPPPA